MGVLNVNVGDAVTPDWREIGCGGAATTTVTDDFNRANSTTTLGVGWTIVTREGVVGHWGIDTNRAYCVDSPVSGSSTFWQTLAVRSGVGADFDMTVTIATAPGSGALLAWRVSVAADDGSFGLGYFLLTATSGVVRLLSGASGGTNVASGTTFVSGDVVRVVAVGSSHRVYQNGTLVYSFTDTNLLTETWHGLAGRDPALGTNPRLDNFSLSSSPMVTGRLKLWDGTRWMREVCSGDDLSGPDWIAYNTYTPPTVAGLRSITFAAPVVLSPGVDYWYVLQDNAANAHAQGVSDVNDTFTNITVTPGMFYSFGTGGGFGSASSSRYPIFGTTASPGTAPAIGYSTSPNDYWGPDSIAQKFQVTSAVTVTGLTQYWGGNAGIAGKWGLARSLSGPAHPLKMWDGTTWQTVTCMTPA